MKIINPSINICDLKEFKEIYNYFFENCQFFKDDYKYPGNEILTVPDYYCVLKIINRRKIIEEIEKVLRFDHRFITVTYYQRLCLEMELSNNDNNLDLIYVVDRKLKDSNLIDRLKSYDSIFLRALANTGDIEYSLSQIPLFCIKDELLIVDRLSFINSLLDFLKINEKFRGIDLGF